MRAVGPTPCKPMITLQASRAPGCCGPQYGQKSLTDVAGAPQTFFVISELLFVKKRSPYFVFSSRCTRNKAGVPSLPNMVINAIFVTPTADQWDRGRGSRHPFRWLEGICGHSKGARRPDRPFRDEEPFESWYGLRNDGPLWLNGRRG